MAYSYSSYTVDSSTEASKTFALGFDYLRSSHITTTVAGSANTDFTVNESAATLTFGSSTTLTVGQAVVLTRTTPKTKNTRIVDFADGSILSESSLDDSALQLLYISQEAFDQSDDTLSKDASDGQWDAAGLRVKNLAIPTTDTDAARKIDVDNAVTGSGNLPTVTSANNDAGLFVNSGSWATRTPAQSRTHLGLGTSSTVDTGTGNGNIPLLDAVGYPSTISGAQIPNILAEGLSVAMVQWGAGALSESTDANWEGSSTRVGTGTTTFINNGPTTGGSYFTARVGNDGIDIAAGKYMAIIPMMAYESDSSGDAYLKLSLAEVDYTGASGTKWETVEAGFVLRDQDSSGGNYPATYVTTTLIDASAGASSVALFGCNADASGNGAIILRGFASTQIMGFIVRVSD